MKILQWKKIAKKAPFHAARTAWSRPQRLAEHGHDFAEVFWIDAGRGIHRINGDSIPLKPGSLVLMRPTDCHGIDQVGDEELKMTNIAFPTETPTFFQPRYDTLLTWPFSPVMKLPTMRQIEPFQRHRFNQWADELAQSPRQQLFIDRFLLNLLADLRQKPDEVPLADAPYWLAQACRAIESPENFAGGVERFLQLCGRSREHVARTVRLYFNTTPTDYVNDVRMMYAIRQLEMSDLSILEIALECGISNLSHFYDLFRVRMEMTPRAYRLLHREPL